MKIVLTATEIILFDAEEGIQKRTFSAIIQVKMMAASENFASVNIPEFFDGKIRMICQPIHANTSTLFGISSAYHLELIKVMEEP